MKNVAGFQSLDFVRLLVMEEDGEEVLRRGLGIRLAQKDVCAML